MLTYFTFLLLFICLPLAILCIYYIRKYQKGKESEKKMIKRIVIALTILTIIAFIYSPALGMMHALGSDGQDSCLKHTR